MFSFDNNTPQTIYFVFSSTSCKIVTRAKYICTSLLLPTLKRTERKVLYYPVRKVKTFSECTTNILGNLHHQCTVSNWVKCFKIILAWFILESLYTYFDLFSSRMFRNVLSLASDGWHPSIHQHRQCYSTYCFTTNKYTKTLLCLILEL